MTDRAKRGRGAGLIQRVRSAVFTRVRGYPPIEVLVARGLQLGERVTITRGVVLDPAHCHLISIGDDVVFGPEVLVLAHDASTKVHLDYARIARVRIEARAFIGARSVVLPGVTIGEDAIVGAGSIVSRDVPAGAVAVGNPARPVGVTEEYIGRHREQLHVLPTYDRDGWTYRVRMDPGNPARMRADLAESDGYVH